MRCLQCGSTLSALKKFTDSDFCSTEHRDQFYAEQQRLILERLKHSASRLQRLRRGSAPEPGRAAAAAVPPPDQAQAPAAIAAFLSAKPDLHNRTFPLLYLPHLVAEMPAARPPARRAGQAQTQGLFFSLVPDLPWPRYNPGLKFFTDLTVSGELTTKPLAPVAGTNGFVSYKLGQRALFPSRHPEAADRTFQRAFVLRMARPKAQVSLAPLRLSARRSGVSGLTILAYRPFVSLVPFEPPVRAPFLEASPILAGGDSLIASGLRLQAGIGSSGLAFLDRIYRMRPKTGVASPDSPAMLSAGITEKFASAVEPARPSFAAGASLDATPGRSDRFVRVRPSGPVTAGTPGQIAVDLDPEFAGVRPGLPGSDPVSNPALCIPVRIDRFFRPRPRGPVDREMQPDLSVPAVQSASVPSPTSPALPTDLWNGCEPGAAERFFRWRPRGPVAGEIDSAKEVEALPEPMLSVPAICESPRPVLAFEPVSLGQPFRMRPRSGVISAGISGLVSAASAEPLQSSPATPPLSGWMNAAPPQVTRMYRMRPKAAVEAATAPMSAATSNASFAWVSAPALPAAGRPTLDFAPGGQERFFRVRPRSGVGQETAKPYQVAETSSLTSPVNPALCRLPATSAEDFTPVFLDRLYRGRPKAAVPSGQASASPLATSGNEPVHLTPATPFLKPDAGEVSPSLNQRFFRMRPRTSVGIETARTSEPVAASPEALRPAPAIRALDRPPAGVFAPAFLDKLYRGRMRSGVPSATSSQSGACLPPEALLSSPAVQSMGLGDCAPALVARMVRFRPKAGANSETAAHRHAVEPVPFPASTPEFVPDWWDVLHGAKPIFMNRMYRMRLKQPAQDTATLSQPIRTKHLPIPDPEPVLATLPKPVESAAPSFLDRLYRMRPKAGRAPDPASNSIPCNAIEPRATSGAPGTALESVSKHWKATPLSIKSIAATIPLLLLIAFSPFGKPTLAADHPVRQAIVQRAAIEHADDFVGGLTHWQGVEKWTRTPSGAVQPAGLGLFTPSLEMRNYLVEFSAQIQKGGVGFVVRAADDRNYQAVKLVTLKAGPLPTMAIQRYAVIDGKEQDRQQTILPITVSADTVYQVSLDVNDQSFTLMVQGKVVDFWSEEQLKTGGAGFFGAKGEKALIQNIRMSHQVDTIGKLFAALAL